MELENKFSNRYFLSVVVLTDLHSKPAVNANVICAIICLIVNLLPCSCCQIKWLCKKSNTFSWLSNIKFLLKNTGQFSFLGQSLHLSKHFSAISFFKKGFTKEELSILAMFIALILTVYSGYDYIKKNIGAIVKE